MKYLYGEFSDNQIKSTVRQMHGEVHKLLLYKDKQIEEVIFATDEDYFNYFNNLLFRFGGLNQLINEPSNMVALMSTLQAAYNEALNDYHWSSYRRLILDAHGYIDKIFEEV